MAPVELLDVQPGDRVLDLCAAPGGKSTQIAAKLQGEGLLVSNDLHPERTKALAKNLELYGVRNGIVLNESPERIAAAFPGFFDRILIDAPCSGEGMFRKDEDMVKQWEPGTPEKYAAMQRDILVSAAAALKPGGTLVYSTCTFAVEENEGTIADFLAAHPRFSLVPAGGTGSFAPGFGELPETARLWPHKVKGEGHFMAVLRHDGSLVPEEEGGDRDIALGMPLRGTSQAKHHLQLKQLEANRKRTRRQRRPCIRQIRQRLRQRTAKRRRRGTACRLCRFLQGAARLAACGISCMVRRTFVHLAIAERSLGWTEDDPSRLVCGPCAQRPVYSRASARYRPAPG